VKRSLLDPLPRPLSTASLVALVALVVCGTGVAVMRFLETAPGFGRGAQGTVQAAPEAESTPAAVSPRAGDRSSVRPSVRGTLSAGGGSQRGDLNCNQATTGGSTTDGATAQTRSIPCSEAAPTLAQPPSSGT